MLAEKHGFTELITM